MNVYVIAESAHIINGSTAFTLAGFYLASGLGNYGSAINEIEISACFRGGQVSDSSLQHSFEQYHAVFLPSLPLVKFLRKRSRIGIRYETRIADASFMDRDVPVSVEVFRTVLEELGETFHLIDDRIKGTDDFDVYRFHDDVTSLVADAPTSNNDLREVLDRVTTEEEVRRTTMNPWDVLDIDWDAFHPAARFLLDKPFFWSNTDAYSPHGNDTGADLLSDFKKWNRSHLEEPAHNMVVALLQAWDIAPIDCSAVDEDSVRPILEKDPIAVSVTDDALIAVAFAAIKLRGCCDRQTKRLAFAAIVREELASVITDRGWNDPAERLKTPGLIRGALSMAPETSIGDMR